MKSKSISNPWASLESALRLKGKSPAGDGWKTMNELIVMLGAPRARIGKEIGHKVKAGEIEVFRGSQVNESGAIAPQIWYRPKP